MKYLIIFAFLVISCNTTQSIPYSRTGEVLASDSDRNTITLLSTSRAHTLGLANLYAERNALENLLFRGIQGSAFEEPMISNEAELTADQKTTLDRFIQSEYEKYLIDAHNTSQSESQGVHTVQRSITLDVKSMRKYLEQYSVIKKFGLQ